MYICILSLELGRRKAAGGIRAAATAAAMYVGYQMFFMVCSSTESRSRRSDGRSHHGCSSSSDRLPRGLRTVEEAKSTVRRFKHGRARRRNRKQMEAGRDMLGRLTQRANVKPPPQQAEFPGATATPEVGGGGGGCGGCGGCGGGGGGGGGGGDGVQQY